MTRKADSKPLKLGADSAQLIEALSNQFRELITENWFEFWSYRDPARPHKGTLNFSIDCRRENYEITSAFGFGIRLKHSVSTEVKYTQTDLNFDGATDNGKTNQKTALR